MSSGKYRKAKDCLNCGHYVEERFCTRCGQENLELKENAWHMITHAIADYFHFESKFFGTMKPLLFKPGQLTKQYVDGKRVAFIHPIRLYIFISIVFFLVILSSSNEPKIDVKNGGTATDTLTKADKDELKTNLKAIPFPGGGKDSLIDKVLADSNIKKSSGSTKTNSFETSLFTVNDSTIEAYEQRQQALPDSQKANIVQRYLDKKSIRMRGYPDAGERIKNQILHNIPKLMFILLPLFALILKLTYWRKRKFYYEHLIYSFHLHSAMFLSVLVTIFLQWIFGFIYDISSLLTLLCFLYLTWYVYRSLRTFYEGKKWTTIFNMSFLFLSYTVLLTLSALLVIIISTLMA